MSKPLISSYSRVFLVEGKARGDHKPAYMSCAKIAGIDYGLGDVERIECPSETQYGKFVEVAQTKGAVSRPSTTLTGRYMSDVESTMLRLAKKGCSMDIQVHIGACQNPSIFNDFDKAIILEGVQASNYGTDDLSAMSSDENGAVNETLDVSASEIYEVMKLGFGEQAGSVVTNEVVDVTLCDTVSCGDCADESQGCEKIYAITKTFGGSPATLPDIVFTINGGAVWVAHDIDSVTGSAEPTAVACIGDYVIVAEPAGIHVVLKEDLNNTLDPTFTKVTTGFVALKGPIAIKSLGNKAFIVGKGGYVYWCDLDPTAGVTVLNAGLATGWDLYAVDALDENFAVAVGDQSSVIKTDNGTDWVSVTGPTGINIAYNCVAVKSIFEWWIGTSDGRLFYTTDGGVTWTSKAFSGYGTGSVKDLVFATPSVGYLSHQTALTKGRILRTYDGGYSWVLLPEGTGSLPAADKFNALAACAADVNFVVGVGLADTSSDGIIVFGQD